MGNVGVFVAHCLSGIPNRPPITLLFKDIGQRSRWNEVDRKLKLTTHGITEAREGFDVETYQQWERDDLPSYQNTSGSTASMPPFGEQMAKSTVSEQGHSSPNASLLQPSFTEAHGPAIEYNKTQLPAIHSASHDLIGEKETCQTDLQKTEIEPRRAELWTTNKATGPNKDMQDNSVEEQNHVIYHLIVATKAPRTAQALKAWAHRLVPESTVLFLQNGLGIIDEVNEQVFPDPKYRPQYMIGVNSHGLRSRRTFDVVHVGEGTMALGIMPQLLTRGSEPVQSLSQAPASSRYLLRTMTRTPAFVAVGFPPTDLLQQQLDKLAVNAVINPLTAILDCKNGGIAYSFNITRIMRLILAEVSLVIRALPELQNVPNVNVRFDTLRLERLVVSIAELTSNNDSSMLQDIRAAKQTEIDYINGYIIRRGEELGVHCMMNYMLLHLVKAKGTLISRDEKHILPFSGTLKRSAA